MSEIFTIQARHCKRCGRLLVSKEGIEKGYGCQCRKKTRLEELEKQPIDGQMNLFSYMSEREGKRC